MSGVCARVRCAAWPLRCCSISASPTINYCVCCGQRPGCGRATKHRAPEMTNRLYFIKLEFQIEFTLPTLCTSHFQLLSFMSVPPAADKEAVAEVLWRTARGKHCHCSQCIIFQFSPHSGPKSERLTSEQLSLHCVLATIFVSYWQIQIWLCTANLYRPSSARMIFRNKIKDKPQ